MSVKSPTLSVTRVEAAAVRPLRLRVLRPGATPDEVLFAGDDAPSTIHLAGLPGEGEAGAHDAQAPVAIASLYLEPPPGEDAPRAWRLRGMAVEPGLQGRGVGGVLLDACVAHVRAQGGDILWCNARTHAAGFYLSRGFTQDGGEFDLPGVGPHYQMRLRV